MIEQEQFEELPALLLIQGTNDDNLPHDMADRFISAYNRVGGHAELELFCGMPHGFITQQPNSANSKRALSRIAAFIGAHGRRDGRETPTRSSP